MPSRQPAYQQCQRWLRMPLQAGLIVLVAYIVACGGGSDANGQPPQPSAQETVPSSPSQQQPNMEPAGRIVLVISPDDVGAHLEATESWPGLAYWLEGSDDPSIAAMPTRAQTSSGRLFVPSPGSSTEETFWLHVFTDVSTQSAVDWVKYLASQPPTLAHLIVPHHELFNASFRPAPLIGDTAVSIELLHGHSGGCWRSVLLVFAQAGVIVFLNSAIELPQLPAAATRPTAAERCDLVSAPTPLTNVEAIGLLISERIRSQSIDPA